MAGKWTRMEVRCISYLKNGGYSSHRRVSLPGGSSDFVRTLAKIINELIELREVFLYAALLSHNPQPPKITKELIELR